MTANRPEGHDRLGPPSRTPCRWRADQLHQTQAPPAARSLAGRRRRAAAMCTPPPQKRNTAVLMLGFGVCCMAMCNATLGFMMFGERGVENRAKLRALLDKPRP